MKTPRTAGPTCFAAGWRCVLVLLPVVVSLTGCAAFHPIRGVPAPYVPPEFLGPSRSGKKTIDLSLLVQTPPDAYRIAAGDVLSVYIPGVLGSLNVDEDRQIGETPPINLSSNPADPPTMGYPVTVRDDGTIPLPYIDPINVHGMTLTEIELAIRKAYTQDANILNGERDRVLVSLQRRREYRVIVVRQETAGDLALGAQQGTLNIGNSKRGTARIVRLPAYENDVLHALANSEQGSDGLPGLDAKNTIYIIRRKKGRSTNDVDVRLPAVPDGARVPVPTFADPVPEPAAQGAAVQPPRPPVMPSPPRWELQFDPHLAAPTMTVPTTAPASIGPVAEPPRPNVAPQPEPIAPSPTPAEAPSPKPPAPRADSPPPVPQTEPPAPMQKPESASPREPGRPPLWPAPAAPPPSIQRTSGQTETPPAPARWPVVRGQSPDMHSWGHSNTIDFTAESSLTPSHTPTMPPMGPTLFGYGNWDPQPAASATAVSCLPLSGVSQLAELPSSQAGMVDAARELSGSWNPSTPQFPQGYTAVPPDRTWIDNAEGFGAGHDTAWEHLLIGFDSTVDNPSVVKIPIRLAEGERPTFTERDIILEDGDIVFIESRETEVFYTGGLLGGGQYTLPRDYDLRVLEAISISQSPQNNRQGSGRAIGGVSALNQDVTISASHVIILRTLPNGTRIPIEVDLYKAVRRPEENLLIQPGDIIFLQYTKLEAVAAFVERHLLEGALFGVAAAQFNNPSNGN